MHLRKLFSIFFFLIILNNVHATDTAFIKNERNRFYAYAYTKTIFKNKTPKLKSQFGVIETLIDNRKNLSVSGVYNYNRKKIFWYEFLTKQTLDTFFNTEKADSKNKIVIVLNDLWFFNSKIEKEKLKFEKDIENFFSLKLGYRVHIYGHIDDVYYPIKKIDTIFSLQKYYQDYTRSADDLLDIALAYTANAIDSCLKNETYKKRSPISDSVLNKAYNYFKKQSKLLPLQGLKKGVYNTYQDLINNKPSADSFNIEFYKFEQVGYHHLYVKNKSSNKYLLQRDLWGVFDGINLWINYNGYLSVLYEKEGLYYWLGIEGAEDHYFDNAVIPITPNMGLLVPDTRNIVDDFYLKRAMHYLDLNTGTKAW